MDRLKKHCDILRLLYKAKPKVRASLIQNASTDLLTCLAECSINILKGNVPLTKTQKEKLRRQRHKLRLLTSKKVSKTNKKKIIQKGGFLSALLAPIVGGILGTLPQLFQ